MCWAVCEVQCVGLCVRFIKSSQCVGLYVRFSVLGCVCEVLCVGLCV